MKFYGDTSVHLILTVISVTLCILWEHAEGVAPRRSRSRPRSSLQEKTRRAQYQTYLEDLSHKALFRPSTTLPPTQRHFRASVARCCKIGDRTARKRLSCSLDEHAVTRKNNLVHQAKLKITGPEQGRKTFTDILIQRIAKCSTSKYAGNFEKCCTYRQEYLKEMASCRAYSKSLRRKCRQDTRKKFP